MNWLEYTQFVARDGKKVFILPERVKEVSEIVSEHIPFITRQNNYELFQRRYGLDSTHIKDTRNLLKRIEITDFMVAEIMVKRMFISLALKEPICSITDDVILKIYEQSGIRPYIIAEVLEKNFPNGAIDVFMPNYFEMAFMGFKQSREFAEATATIFRDVFNFNSTWLGSDSSGKDVPDILLVSDKSGFQAVIETKASSKYTLPSTHRDKMIEHYLPEIKDCSNSDLPLGFFSYIAGGFSYTIPRSLNEIVSASSVNGSAMPISVFIKMIEKNVTSPYTHKDIKKIFSLNRKVGIWDL